MKTFSKKELRQINGGSAFDFCGQGNIIIDIFPIGDPPFTPTSDTLLSEVVKLKAANGFGERSRTI